MRTVEQALAVAQLQCLDCGRQAVVGWRMEQPGGRVVKPRSDRYCLSEQEQAGYSAFVEMLSQLEENSPTVKAIAICEKVPAGDLILDESGTVDPHFWLDVPLWLKVCANLKSALLESGQLPIEDLNRRHSELVSDLEALHQSVLSTLAPIPTAKRVLVTAHDAFAYFGNRYEFEVHGIQGISTESEPSLKRVNQLVELLSERKIPSIFIESTVPERNVLALIEGCQKLGHQLTVGGKLYSDAPGPPESGADSWSKMVRHNAQTIAEGLR